MTRSDVRPARLISVLIAAVIATSAAACTSSVGPATSAGQTTSAAVAPRRSSQVPHLTGNELRYGSGATSMSGVVYQPDVVRIQGGADAVRAVSASGLTWTIDAHAPGAAELAVGKIMLATSFGTGRVLKLTRSAGQVTVVLGPVAITDVIQDADLGSATPIPIGATLAYDTPTAPGSAVDDPHDPLAPTANATSASSSAPHSFLQNAAAPATPTLPPPSSTPTPVGAGDFQVTPFCCAGGVGVNIGYNKGDGRLQATLTLKLNKPTASFRLEISHGRLVEATVQVHGAAAFQVVVDAATRSSAGDFRGTTVHVPETLTIPLTGFGVPLVLSVNQDFYLSMQLIGESAFHTKGGYSISGDLGFGYRNGSPSLMGTTLAVADPMTANTRVLGVASGVITVGWYPTVSVGVGVLGFNAGVWYRLGVALSVVADGLSLTAGCVDDALVVDGSYGIGWTVPRAVVAVLNLFLRAVHARTLTASGGFAWGPDDLWRPTPGKFCRTNQP